MDFETIKRVAVHIFVGAAMGAVFAFGQSVGADPIIAASPGMAGVVGFFVGVFSKRAHEVLTQVDNEYGEGSATTPSEDLSNASK